MTPKTCWTVLALLGIGSLAWLGADPDEDRPRAGILDRQAPSWGVTEWFNLPGARETLDVGDFRGKVVYLYAFQSWCPGCHRTGFPTLEKLIAHYQGNDQIAFVAVQTAFEGFRTNSVEAAKRTADRYELAIPIGHSGSENQRSILMQRYRTGGTPWTVVIDRAGIVRYNDFHIDPARAVTLVDSLLAERPIVQVETLPASRGGQDLVGTKLPAPKFDRELVKRPPEASLTLYRWWTDTCAYCEASLPAIDRLRKKYGSRGLGVVGVYHPKPPRDVPDNDIRAAAREAGFGGAIVVDRDWSELRRFYLGSRSRRATSASFLVDAEGTIRFVHPGPDLYPSRDPKRARQDQDYRMLERAIDALLPPARDAK